MTATHRIESLDLMRGLAALFVAASHFFIYQEIWSTGFEAISVLAVEVFFVLSGFVLAPQIIDCVQAGRARPVAIFLVRRWMRTVPPFLVALACMSALTPNPRIGDLVRYGLYVQNLFGQSNHDDYFPVAWSLSVEEWFYLTFPALLVAAGALRGRTDLRFIITMTVLFIGATSAWRCLAGDYDHWGYEVRRVVAFRIDSIAYGVMLFIALDRVDRKKIRRWMVVAAFAWFGAATGLAFDVTQTIALSESFAAKQAFPVAAALFGASALTLFWCLDGVVGRSAAARRIARFLGRISYSVYLFHLIFLTAAAGFLGSTSIVLAFTIHAVALTAFCAVFYTVFERPILAQRPAFEVAEPRSAGKRS